MYWDATDAVGLPPGDSCLTTERDRATLRRHGGAPESIGRAPGRVAYGKWPVAVHPLAAPEHLSMPTMSAVRPLSLALIPDGAAPAPHARGQFDGLLDDWRAGLAPTTARTYTQQLGAFAEWLGVPFPAVPSALLGGGRGDANRLVRRYRGTLLARGLAPATVNVALGALRSLVGLARAVGEIDWDLDVPGVRVTAYRDTRGPGVDVVRGLLVTAAAHRRPARAARDIAVLRVLYDLALRCSELTTLHAEHVERSSSGTPIALHVLAKGHRQRVRVELTPTVADALSRWLVLRDSTDQRLFCLSNRGVGKLLDRLAHRAGLARTHPHGLRHTAITAALDAGHDVREVQRFSRHRRLETLMIYDDQRARLAAAVAASVARQL